MLPFRKEIRSTELAPAKESWQPAGQPGSEPEQRKGGDFYSLGADRLETDAQTLGARTARYIFIGRGGHILNFDRRLSADSEIKKWRGK